MKLFMEINPALFDECSAEYAAHQEGAEARQAARLNRWKALEESAAKQRQKMPNHYHPGGSPMMIATNEDEERITSFDKLSQGRQWETTVIHPLYQPLRTNILYVALPIIRFSIPSFLNLSCFFINLGAINLSPHSNKSNAIWKVYIIQDC